MGFFNNLAIDRNRQSPDHCYVPHYQLLLWRLDDLKNRQAQLQEKQQLRDADLSFCDADLSTILPKDLLSLAAVERAIQLTSWELEYRYQISVSPEPILDQLTDAQIALDDFFVSAA